MQRAMNGYQSEKDARIKALNLLNLEDLIKKYYQDKPAIIKRRELGAYQYNLHLSINDLIIKLKKEKSRRNMESLNKILLDLKKQLIQIDYHKPVKISFWQKVKNFFSHFINYH